MVEMNVEIGQKLTNVKCCGQHPTITDYNESIGSFRIGYKCEICNSTGGFGMGIPAAIRKKKLEEMEIGGGKF